MLILESLIDKDFFSFSFLSFVFNRTSKRLSHSTKLMIILTLIYILISSFSQDCLLQLVLKSRSKQRLPLHLVDRPLHFFITYNSFLLFSFFFFFMPYIYFKAWVHPILKGVGHLQKNYFSVLDQTTHSYRFLPLCSPQPAVVPSAPFQRKWSWAWQGLLLPHPHPTPPTPFPDSLWFLYCS